MTRTPSARPRLAIEPLTHAAFAPFGDVIDSAGRAGKTINEGFAERIDGLAAIDVAAEGGTVNVSMFSAKARPAPIAIALMERHPLGSQLFQPLEPLPWLIVVCGDPGRADSFRAFRAGGHQGVNYARGVWHHPLLVASPRANFIVVDRAGPGHNLEEIRLSMPLELDSRQTQATR